jgi:hypothetical protein
MTKRFFKTIIEINAHCGGSFVSVGIGLAVSGLDLTKECVSLEGFKLEF